MASVADTPARPPSSPRATTTVARAAGARVGGWWREVALFGLAYLAYQAARVAMRGDAADALDNARWVFDAQARLGLGVERSVQDALLGTPWLAMLDWVYLAAQTVVLAAGVVFVYRANRRVYRVLRTTLLATWVLALPVYALFPTAPPRLAGLGFADAVSLDTPIGLAGGSTTILFNPYAAVPSLHAGFAVALGVAVFASARRLPLRVAGLLWGPLVVLAVLATGNHFVFDVGAGVALTAAGFGFARWRERRTVRPVRPGPGLQRPGSPLLAVPGEQLEPGGALVGAEREAQDDVHRARHDQLDRGGDRKSTRLNSSHIQKSRMPSSA